MKKMDEILPVTREQVEQLELILAQQVENYNRLFIQMMDLNQCVECGEMDHQDGIRIDGEFRCLGCVGGRK